MNLLERRRTLEQIQESQAEGGGDNDGKFVVFKQGTDMYLYESSDFGQTFSYITGSISNYVLQINLSSSVNIDSRGYITFGNRWNPYPAGSIITGSYPNFYSQSLSTASVNNPYSYSSPRYLKAFQISSKGKYAIALVGTNANNTTKISLFSTGSSIQTWKEISYATPWSSSVLHSFLEASRNNLSEVIVGGRPGQKLGIRAFATTSYISTDWVTWNNLDDIIEGDTTNDVGPVQWSADGKYCGVVKNSTLFLSQDRGNSFTKISFLSGSIGCFDASQKFNTLYVGYSGSSKTLQGIYKSQDMGETWTHVYTCSYQPSISVQYCPIFATNDAGDKLILVDYSGSTWGYAFYSWDGGETWNPSLSGSRQFSIPNMLNAASSFAMSRDHVNFSS